jgi:hypothetical protein
MEEETENRPEVSGSMRRMLYDEVKKINLVDFIAKNSGASFSRSGSSYQTVCPMPSHRDTKPSFNVTEKNGMWFYNCFGCGSGGTIIDFSKDYWSLDHPSEALILIMQKEGIKGDCDAMIRSIRDAKVKMDFNKKLECSHFVAASNCRRLLRRFPGDKAVETWVAKAYRAMNVMLDGCEIRKVERIGEEAMVRLMGGT